MGSILLEKSAAIFSLSTNPLLSSERELYLTDPLFLSSVQFFTLSIRSPCLCIDMVIAASPVAVAVATSVPLQGAPASRLECSREALSSGAWVSLRGHGRKFRTSMTTATVTPRGFDNNAAVPRNVLTPERVSVDDGGEFTGSAEGMDGKAFQDFARPDSFGRYGIFGGKYVPETLIAALAELENAHRDIVHSADFQEEFKGYLKDYVGRETPLYFAERLTEHYKKANGGEGPDIYLKREDLNHTGAHKINNAVGQALLAKRLGKKRVIAETGAGQHGVATATVCARFGLQCVVYMGARDMERQALNVFRMRLLGAEVRPVHSGTATLKDATSEAIRDWVTNVETSSYILGSVTGPHPGPMLVRDLQKVIGEETRRQAMEKWGGKPDVLVACVGGGSNAMGLFHEFIDDEDVRLIGVEAAGFGVETDKHAAPLTKGQIGVLHGAMSYLLQDNYGQIIEPHSISAGLDYPGVGPEHSFLKYTGRAEYYSITDDEALEAFKLLSMLEGIIPALETSHALAYLEKLCPTLTNGTKVVLNLSGRGDKDVNTAIKLF